MRNLILTAATVAMMATSASAYYTAGVSLSGDNCTVNTTPQQDRWWKHKMAIPEHSVEDSIQYHQNGMDYHPEGSRGHNRHKASKCWLEDRGDFMVYIDSLEATSPGFNLTEFLSYSEIVDWYMDSGNDIVEMPWDLMPKLGWNNKADIISGWMNLHRAEAQDAILRPFKQGWENAVFMPAQAAREGQVGNGITQGFYDANQAALDNTDFPHLGSNTFSQSTYDATVAAILAASNDWGQYRRFDLVRDEVYYADDDVDEETPLIRTVVVSSTNFFRYEGRYYIPDSDLATPVATIEAREATPATMGGYPLNDWLISITQYAD